MVSKIRQILAWLGDDEASASPSSNGLKKAAFILRYGDMEVGRLVSTETGWEFNYSQSFKSQDRVRTLPDFPKTGKSYKMEELWPFFASRIPSLEQPQVQRIIQEEQINAEDKAALLSRFGRESIANPFKLVEA